MLRKTRGVIVATTATADACVVIPCVRRTTFAAAPRIIRPRDRQGHDLGRPPKALRACAAASCGGCVAWRGVAARPGGSRAVGGWDGRRPLSLTPPVVVPAGCGVGGGAPRARCSPPPLALWWKSPPPAYCDETSHPADGDRAPHPRLAGRRAISLPTVLGLCPSQRLPPPRPSPSILLRAPPALPSSPPSPALPRPHTSSCFPRRRRAGVEAASSC